MPLRSNQQADAERRIEQHFKRGFQQYNDNAFVQKQIAKTLADLLIRHCNASHFSSVLEIGCGTGFLTNELVQRLSVGHWTINDLVLDSEKLIAPLLKTKPWFFLAGSIETEPLPQRYDLIASASVFQWVKDTPALLNKLSDKLQPGGFLIFSSFAPKHFNEIQSITNNPNVMSYFTIKQWQALLAQGWLIKHIEQDVHIATFSSVLKLLLHLRNTGVNANAQQQWSRENLKNFEHEYKQRFTDKNGNIGLTYAPVYIIAQKRMSTTTQ